MKFLITGGMGFLGSHFSEKLLNNGHEVCAIDLYENKSLDYLNDWDSYTPIIDSIHHENIVNKLIDSSDVVMHLAAIAEPEQYVKYPRKTIDINLRASLNILDRVITTDKIFFYSSSFLSNFSITPPSESFSIPALNLLPEILVTFKRPSLDIWINAGLFNK